MFVDGFSIFQRCWTAVDEDNWLERFSRLAPLALKSALRSLCFETSEINICGLESAETYPYTGTFNLPIANCKFDKKRMVAPFLDDCTFTLGENFAWGEALTAKLLQEGPLATGINARARSFQFYSKGTHLTKALLT